MSLLHGSLVGVVALVVAVGIYWWAEIRKPKPIHWINVDQQTEARRLKLASMQHGAVKGFEAHRSDPVRR